MARRAPFPPSRMPASIESSIKLVCVLFAAPLCKLVQITLNYGRPGPTDKGCMVRDNEHSRIFIRLNRFLCTPTCFVLTCFPLISAGEGNLQIVQSLMLNSVNCILIVRRLSLNKKQRIPPIISILIQASMDNISRCRLRTLHESLF